jgi:hypothetical protein
MKNIISCAAALGLIAGLAACSSYDNTRTNLAAAPADRASHAVNPLVPSTGNPATSPLSTDQYGAPRSGW